MKPRKERRETLLGIIEAAKEGKDPAEYLSEEGYSEPEGQYNNLRSWARKNAPELAEQLPDRWKTRRIRKGTETIEPEAGKNYELIPQKAEVTKVGKVPDPDKGKLPVVAVESRVLGNATYRAMDGGMHLNGLSVINGITLNAYQWTLLAQEIIQAIRQLNVTPATIGGDSDE